MFSRNENEARFTLLRSIGILLAATFGSIFVGVAGAMAGPLEINQACANGPEGCFPGDAPGFPVEITTSGSYVLTSDLEVSGSNTSGIRFVSSAFSAKVDLAGHTLRGPVVCTGTSGLVFCPPGTSVGVDAANWVRHLEVTNGRITGFPAGGIVSEAYTRASSLDVSRNGEDGLTMRRAGIVSDSTLEDNGELGARVERTLFSGVSASANRSAGLYVNESLLERTTLRNNGGFGVVADLSTFGRELVSSSNFGGFGIQLSTAFLVDSVFQGNIGHGVSSFGKASIQHSTIRGHSEFGLTGDDVTYRGLTLSDNSLGDVGLVDPLFGNLGGSVCSGVVCP